VVLQDFTGVPAVVDLAAMRSAVVRMTGDESRADRVNPLVPCDLVIDHSVQVDSFANSQALRINAEKEFERNGERYRFLKWGQQAFDNFRVVPPATGIVHQVNLEYLAKVVWEGDGVLYPDSLVGTDSHTTMINGLGVVGWGVGGIEAEAVMLGQPIYMLIPEVVGMRLTGELREGVTATDLVLRVTELLRAHGVVGKFVEFHGPGLATMPLANRATIANMAPEYGATLGFFPVDENTLRYMHLSGRDEALIETVERYCKENSFWRDDDDAIVYSSDLELDMSSVEPSLAGPKRPQDRIALSAMRSNWHDSLGKTFEKPEVAAAQRKGADEASVSVHYDGAEFELKNGAVCIAAITSCTNTSNPEVMLAAGLVARKAARLGLTRKPWVKTSLAPGSKVVTEYYKAAGLIQDLEALGFHNVGYGCTTCIGNSGPLPEPISKAVNENELVVCSVLSGNRNFEGRIGPDIQANYLASPPLVVAYAIAGTVDIDLQNDPLGRSSSGEDVFLRDIWPSQDEVDELVASSLSREQFTQQYASVFDGSEEWQRVAAPIGQLYAWDDDSTYVQEPPFFVDLTPEVRPIATIEGARVLCKLGDSVTTDHISPAGSIASGTPAARYLDSHGVARAMYNSLGARRGNDRVMTRATFGNIRVKNQLAPGTEGGFTVDFSGREAPEGASPLPDEAPKTGVAGRPVRFIYDAVQNYKDAGIPLVVLAGIDYGMGSSRDWAAKGTFLLNVKAVIAKSFERIHRSNLVGMGVLPLCFVDGEGHEELSLDGSETFEIPLDDGLEPRQTVAVHATHPETGKVTRFETLCRIDTPVEVEYYRNGGILHTVLRKMAAS
jgi:aconitate hydratase